MRNRCPACGKLVPRGRHRSPRQRYCNRKCWGVKPPLIIRVEKEFDEPFDDVVAGLAEQGCTRPVAAGAIGMSPAYFRQVLRSRDLYHLFDGNRAKPKPATRPGWPKGVPRPRSPKYSDEEILKEVRLYPDLNVFKTMASISYETVHRRFGRFSAALSVAYGNGGSCGST